MTVKIKQVLKSKKSWKKEYNKRYDWIKEHINDEDCFCKPVEIKLNDCKAVMGMANYLINLMIWQPMVRFKMIPGENEIFNKENVTKSDIKEYLDNVYVRKLRGHVDIHLLNVEMIKVIEHMKTIVENFGVIMGITYNFYQLHELCKKKPQLRDLLYTKLEDGMQPKEIEDYANEQFNKFTDIISNSNTGFAPLLNSGAGFNMGQLRESLVVVGNKPALDGTTLPVPINTNLFIGGLNTPTHYTIDAFAGRKALILNKKFTGIYVTFLNII